jgi:hypothetical protein
MSDSEASDLPEVGSNLHPRRRIAPFRPPPAEYIVTKDKYKLICAEFFGFTQGQYLTAGGQLDNILLCKKQVLEAWLEFNYSTTQHGLLPEKEFLSFEMPDWVDLYSTAWAYYQPDLMPIYDYLPESEKVGWTRKDHRIRFLHRFIKSETKLGGVFYGVEVTAIEFGRVNFLLTYLDAVMLQGSPSRSRTTIDKAMAIYGMTVGTPPQPQIDAQSDGQYMGFANDGMYETDNVTEASQYVE